MRRAVAMLTFAALLVSLSLQAADPPQPDASATEADLQKLRQQAAFEQERLRRQFGAFQQSLLTLAQRYEKSSKPEDREKAQVLRKAIELAGQEGIDNQFHKLVVTLTGSGITIQEINAAIGQNEQLTKTLREMIAILLTDNQTARLKEEQQRLQDLLKQLDRVIREQKLERSKTESGRVDNQQLARGQAKVTESTQKLAKNMAGKGKDAKAEAKTGKADPKDAKDGKGEPKDGKGEPKNGKGDPKDAKGQPKDGKGQPKDGKGEPKDAKGQPKDGKGEPKDGKGEPKDNQGQPKDNQGQPKDSQGQPKDSKGQPKDSKGQPKNGQGQPKDGQGEPQDGQQQQQQQQQSEEDQPGRERVQDATENQKKAEDNLKKKEREKASGEQDEAIKKLEEARREVERRLKQLREEEKERLLANLEARCQRMLALQIEVYEGTKRVDATIKGNEDHRPTRAEDLKAGELSGREGVIVTEANKALQLLEEDGTAVAIPQVLEQARNDMVTVQARLFKTDVGSFTQTMEEEIISMLKEVIEALKKAQQDLKDKKDQPPPPPGSQQQQMNQRLIDILAELRMIRQLQLRVNTRTVTYGRQYTGEQADAAEIQKLLHELAQRQEKIQKATKDIATGKAGGAQQ